MRLVRFTIFLLFVFQAVSANAAIKMLLAFDDSLSLKTTAKLVKLGISLGIKQHSLGGEVEVSTLDIGDDVKTTSERLESTIRKSKPDVIVGGITSNQALAIGEIAEREKILFMTPFATLPKVTEGRRFVFRGCFDDDFQVLSLRKFIFESLRLQSGVILFNQGQSYARGVQKIFAEESSRVKGTKLASIGFASSRSLPGDITSRLVALKPEFILLPSYQIEAAEILSQLKVQLPKATFIGTDSWGGGRLFNRLLQQGRSPIKGFYVQHWSDSFAGSANRKFLKLLSQPSIPEDLKFNGTAMNAPIAIGYDAVQVVLEGFRKSRRQPSDAIRNLVFHGATGRFVYRGAQTPQKSLFIFSINEKTEKYFKEFR